MFRLTVSGSFEWFSLRRLLKYYNLTYRLVYLHDRVGYFPNEFGYLFYDTDYTPVIIYKKLKTSYKL